MIVRGKRPAKHVEEGPIPRCWPTQRHAIAKIRDMPGNAVRLPGDRDAAGGVKRAGRDLDLQHVGKAVPNVCRQIQHQFPRGAAGLSDNGAQIFLGF